MPTTFSIPTYDQIKEFFHQKPNQEITPEIEKMMKFFRYQIATAIDKNIEEERLHLCGTLILMISTPQHQHYGLEKETFGKDPKRTDIAKTIKALFTQNIDDFNHLIQKTNDEFQAPIFDEIGPCSDLEKKTMKEFCTDYTIHLASKISSLFKPAENNTWRLSGLPMPNALLNHQDQRLEMLGHREEENDTPGHIATNPYGYNLRSRGQKRALGE